MRIDPCKELGALSEQPRKGDRLKPLTGMQCSDGAGGQRPRLGEGDEARLAHELTHQSLVGCGQRIKKGLVANRIERCDLSRGVEVHEGTGEGNQARGRCHLRVAVPDEGRNQMSSEVIRGHQRSSAVIRDHPRSSVPISARIVVDRRELLPINARRVRKREPDRMGRDARALASLREQRDLVWGR